MELGIIGLGRMGSNMTVRLLKGGHRVVGNARTKESVDRIVEKGAEGAYTLDELVNKLDSPRVIWLMIPAGSPVDKTIQALIPEVDQGDIIIDGGNSYYKDTKRRANLLKEKKINFVDVGTSGGVWGLTEGYSMMVGGEKAVVNKLSPIFETLAPASDKGWGHVGPNGAGHFVKMVHNGIEYGLMQAYAEGFSLMKKKEEFKLDMHQIAEIWSYGSVVRSWLLDLTAQALSKGSDLNKIIPYVEDSGEGRWTVFEAIDLDVAAPVITLSLLKRLSSRDKESYADRLLALMRESFGGHAVKRNE
ncbi:MAG: decarboxylating 6-phosphogluconate dehydrogenase [Candidatus Bathyarchaeota archaeon]|nr:decarboxylating 6-phosphogluconate dehydrogenase [Candidatus Bathyarchaeota archaeon]